MVLESSSASGGSRRGGRGRIQFPFAPHHARPRSGSSSFRVGEAQGRGWAHEDSASSPIAAVQLPAFAGLSSLLNVVSLHLKFRCCGVMNQISAELSRDPTLQAGTSSRLATLLHEEAKEEPLTRQILGV